MDNGDGKQSTPERPRQAAGPDAFIYIHELTLDLRRMALDNGATFLGYLLEMTATEAERCAKENQASATRRPA